MRFRSALVIALLLTGLPFVPGQSARADHSLPPLDPSKIDYTPIGYYGPVADGGTSPTIPVTPGSGPPMLNDPNPTGKWVPYDTNVWESLTLPHRHPGDNCNALPEEEQHADCLEGDRDDDASDPATRTGYTGYDGPNGTSPVHGTCPPSADLPTAGECFNNQLEYLDYYEHAMETSFADLGLTVKRYGFISAGAGRGGVPAGSPGASGGQAYNISATIPGADHPEETVIVGAHYDVTDTAPAPAWDSSEGHTEIMRMAYIMADYYRKTGTRPSATLKFIPWDSEESGTFGSQDYVNNNIPPGEEDQVRAYFNVDPCAGAYPAFEEGTNRQVNEVLQLSNPSNWEDDPEIKARIEAFNTTAEQVIDQVLDRLDDRLTRPGGTEVPIFVSNAEAAAGTDDKGSLGGAATDRDDIVTALGGLALFGSDYSNFDEVGIPIFNLFPDYFGPHADDTPSDGGVKGIEILHTNNDNLLRINRLTSALNAANLPDATGTFVSEGWAKGMEFCAQVEAWGMLQPNAAGAQTANTDPVAYFEALPNEAVVNDEVTFDATGTYQYANVGTRAMEPETALSYAWDFGDGESGSGKVVKHRYDALGRYQAKLIVTGAGGKTDTMTIPVTVVASNMASPVLAAIAPAEAEDGTFGLSWEFAGEQEGFQHFRVEESPDFRTLFLDPAEALDNWTVTPPEDGSVEEWQPSDSGTQKFRGNQRHSGARSFWTGVSPPNFNPGPTNTSSILTLKNPVAVPSLGDPELAWWQTFQSEGDDQGRVEIAQFAPGVPEDQLEWLAVDVTQAVNTAAGGPEDHRVCDPSNPNTLSHPFTFHRVPLDFYKGKQILVRFNYSMGPDDRALSQPCGWYVDDITMYTGTWNAIGTTKETTFPVTNRPNGIWSYRVKGVYPDDITTAASNVETVSVTKSDTLPNAELSRCLKIPGNVILGSEKKDRLIGTNGKDVLCGFNGKDTFNGKGGNDIVFGGGGNDKLRGGAGNDKLFGEKGKDVLAGGKGNDKLKGGPKADLLKGGAGRDACGSNAQDTQLKC